jgi:hypothetical protein
VVWGGLNGVGLVVYKLWKDISPWKDKTRWYNHALGVAITLIFITFTRTWFRSETSEGANQMLIQIATRFNASIIPEVIWGFRYPFLVMLLGYIIHWLPSSFKDRYKQAFIDTPLWVKIAAGFLTAFFIYQVLSSELQAFIYFAF